MDVIAGARVGLDDVTMGDGVLVLLLAVVGGFEGGAHACFEMHVFVVVVFLEVSDALLLLEFEVALPVLVAGVGAGFAAGDEVGHGGRVIGRLFSLVGGEAPGLRLSGSAHGRHAWFGEIWFWVCFY